MEYRSVQLADGLWSITEGMVQCYLIEGNSRALLFDSCASGGTEFKAAVETLTKKPVQLIISHSDQDHTGGQEFYPGLAMHPSELSHYASKGNEVKQVLPLWEADIISLGGTTLEVFLIPGHTPGSIALIDRRNRRLFVGDTLSDQWIYLFGAGRSLKAYIASLKKLESLSPLFDTIYCCHGSMALGLEWLKKTRVAAEKLLAGELKPSDPPREMPAKSYSHDGVTFLY